MSRDPRQSRPMSDFVDWMDDRWDASPLGRGRGWGRTRFAGQPFRGWHRRRGRGLFAVAAAVLAAVAAERLFFRHPFRRRSPLGNLFYAALVLWLGAAAVSAWRRRGQPLGW